MAKWGVVTTGVRSGACPRLARGAQNSSPHPRRTPSLLVLLIVRSPLEFLEAIARVAIVVDSVLTFQLLDLLEVALGVRAHAVERVQERLLETTIQAHPLVLGQIVE